MAYHSEGMEYARRLRKLIWEAREAGYHLCVDGDDLDLRADENDDYITTLTQVEVDSGITY